MERQVKTARKHLPLSDTDMEVIMHHIGDDIVLMLTGGQRPHIGSTVMSVPRPSHTGVGYSSTSSVLNLFEHKDEAVCRLLSEAIAAKYHAVTVCTGGFHLDNITAEQIEEVIQAARDLAAEL